MSAFTPYKSIREKVSQVGSEIVARNLLQEDRVEFPYELTSLVLGLPQFRSNFLELSRIRKEEAETEEEKKRKRNEGFLMKNLLRREDKRHERERKALEARKKFDDHASRVETLVSNLGKSEQGHRCIYCGKIYSRKYGLKIHVRTHTGYKPLKCKYCARPFGDPSNLNKHVRLHAQGPTPYKCQYCDKLLVRRRDLERHIKSRHTNQT